MKKSVSLSLVVFLALTVVGFAYAAWADSLTIEGTVSEAQIGLKFVHDELTDIVENDQFATIVDVDTSLDESRKNLSVTVTKAVPDYYAEIHYNFENVGQLPVVIKNVSVVANSDTNWLAIDLANAGQNVSVGAGLTSGDYYVVLTCLQGSTDPTVLDTASFGIEFDVELDTTGSGT